MTVLQIIKMPGRTRYSGRPGNVEKNVFFEKMMKTVATGE